MCVWFSYTFVRGISKGKCLNIELIPPAWMYPNMVDERSFDVSRDLFVCFSSCLLFFFFLKFILLNAVHLLEFHQIWNISHWPVANQLLFRFRIFHLVMSIVEYFFYNTKWKRANKFPLRILWHEWNLYIKKHYIKYIRFF